MHTRSMVLLLINFVFVFAIVALVVLSLLALIKYLKSSNLRKERALTRQSLGERIKECRTSKHMTQEFVAESLNVSRQAVSKWENGSSEPSTSNLLALAKLFDMSPADLLENLH